MAIKIRRGTDAERISIVFEEGEVLYTTDTKLFYIGDGVTPGGNLMGFDANLQQVTDNGSSTTNAIEVGGITTPYVQLDTAATPILQPGMFAWNNVDGTADLRLKGNNVTLQLGQENVVRVVNKTGSDLLESDYKVVRVRIASEGGAQGQRLAVVLAQGNSDPDSVTTLGIVTENIANNQEGFITVFGNVNEINTTGSLQGETWVDGDVLYLSPTTPGKLTNIKPIAPNHTVTMGYVVYAHAIHGKIFVKVDNGYELDELHNVKITSVANNDLLQYDSTQQVWKNVAASVAVPTPTLAQVTTAGNTTTNAISVGGLTVATNLIYTDTVNGRVGIGTVSPSEILHIQPSTGSAKVLIKSTTGFVGYDASRANTSSAGLWSFLTGSTVDFGLGQRSGHSDLVVYSYGTSSNIMRWFKSTGNITINLDTDAGYKLDVNGNVRVTNLYSQRVYSSNIADSAGNFYVQSSITAVSIGLTTTDQLSLTTKTTGKTVVLNGNFLIGTTTDAGYKLDVNGTARFSGGANQGAIFGAGTIINLASDAYMLATSTTGKNAGYTANRFSTAEYASFDLLTGASLTSGWSIQMIPSSTRLDIVDRSPSDNTRMTFFNGGNIAINSTTDAGYKLYVNGTAYITQTVTFGNNASFYYGLLSIGLNNIISTNDGVNRVSFGGGNGIRIGSIAATQVATNSTIVWLGRSNLQNQAHTSGNVNSVNVDMNFNPTSGTGTVNLLNIIPTINQTGGANGITRGIYINPTLTAAADFRAIDVAGGKIVSTASITASTSLAQGVYFNNTLVAAANNDVLIGLDINPTTTLSTFTGILSTALRVDASNVTTSSTADKIAAIFVSDGQTRVRITSNATGASFNTGFGLFQGTTRKWSIASYGTNADFTFYNEATSTASLFIAGNTNNVLINTTTDAGYKLDVNGTARINGNVDIKTPSAATIITLGGFNELPEIRLINSNISISSTTSSAILMQTSSGNITNHLSVIGKSNLSNTSTTGNPSGVLFAINFAPTSGTANFTEFSISPTINQTGGANGITRGIHISPTITAAADFRAIETTVGNVIFGSTSGNVGIGTTSPNQPLHVNGRTRIQGSAGNSVHIYNDGTTSYIDSLTSGNAAHDLRISAQNINFYSGTSYGTVYAKLFSTGNFALGSNPTDAGYKLDVNGSTRIKGTGTTSSTYSLFVQNSAGTNLLYISDAGGFTTTTSNFSSVFTNDSNSVQVTGSSAAIRVGGTISITASAILQADSTTKGFLPPRMTTTQKNAISTPAAGLVVYDTTLNKLCVYTTMWETITSL